MVISTFLYACNVYIVLYDAVNKHSVLITSGHMNAQIGKDENYKFD